MPPFAHHYLSPRGMSNRGTNFMSTLTDAHKMAVAGGRKSNLVEVQGQIGEMWFICQRFICPLLRTT